MLVSEPAGGHSGQVDEVLRSDMSVGCCLDGGGSIKSCLSLSVSPFHIVDETVITLSCNVQ